MRVPPVGYPIELWPGFSRKLWLVLQQNNPLARQYHFCTLISIRYKATVSTTGCPCLQILFMPVLHHHITSSHYIITASPGVPAGGGPALPLPPGGPGRLLRPAVSRRPPLDRSGPACGCPSHPTAGRKAPRPTVATLGRLLEAHLTHGGCSYSLR